VRLWDPSNGNELTLLARGSAVKAIALHADLLCSATEYGIQALHIHR
jgi:hypothetical protein